MLVALTFDIRLAGLNPLLGLRGYLQFLALCLALGLRLLLWFHRFQFTGFKYGAGITDANLNLIYVISTSPNQ